MGISTKAEIAFDCRGAMLRARPAVVVVSEQVYTRAQATHKARVARGTTPPAVEHVHTCVGARAPATSQAEAHRHSASRSIRRVLRVLLGVGATTPAQAHYGLCGST